jgi:hypothetical protein
MALRIFLTAALLSLASLARLAIFVSLASEKVAAR